MPDLEQRIADWRAEMTRAGVTDSETLDELEMHLREQIHRLKDELSEDAAFKAAKEELGNPAALRHEFSKLNRGAWGLIRSNPIGLNLLAVWFVLAGVNGITSAQGLFRDNVSTLDFVSAIFLLILCSQVFIGIGLFARRERWRKVALGWSRCALVLFVIGHIFAAIFAPQASATYSSSLGISVVGGGHDSLHYQFLAIPWPLAFLNIMSWLNAGILLGACFFLTNTGTRKLFENAQDA